MRDLSPCLGHVPYASHEVARNAATLHVLANPGCEGIAPWPCSDHWHIGHSTAGAGQRCKSDPVHRATRRRIARVLAHHRRRR